MKPNWTSAPEWANYAAQELSGSWYFHELQPVYVEIVGEWRSKGRTQIVPKVSVQAKDTMEARPLQYSVPIQRLGNGEWVAVGPMELVAHAQQE